VSTEDQEKEGTSLQSQLEACQKLAKEHGYEATEPYILREVYSGLTLDRPNLAKLRGWLNTKEIKAVVIYSSDRFSRDGYDFLTLIKDCEEAGVELLCVTEPIEHGQVGQLLSYVRGWSSRQEADKIKERTMRGKRVLMNQGLLPQGTGKGLYGYQWDPKNKKRVPLESEVNVVQRIFSMIAEGASYFITAKTLNDEGVPAKTGAKWHPLTIRRIVKNTAYYGDTCFGVTQRKSRSKVVYRSKEDWVHLAEATPPIISRELYEQAQKALKRPKSRPGTALVEYILTGHLVCGHCGSPMVGSCLNGRYRYYYCTGQRATSTRGKICNAHYVRADMLEELIWGKARKVLENPQLILAELDRQLEEKEREHGEESVLDAEISKLRRKIANYEYEEKRMVSLFRHDEVSQDFILDEISSIKKARSTDIKRLTDLELARSQHREIERTEIRLEKMSSVVRKNLEKCTGQEKRLAFDALDIKATVTKGRIQLQGVLPRDLVTIVQTSA